MENLEKVYINILDRIGNTPILEVKNIDTGKCRLFLKLENLNPGGSIKDRIALSMINDAESKGYIKPGDTIIEATAGNTGIGLALVAGIKNYKLILVVPDKTSIEKINILKAMGAEVIITRSDVKKGHPDFYQDKAKQLAKDNNYYCIDQFSNPANSLAHELTTAPEIFNQLNSKVDAVVAGVGSSGTISGITAYCKKNSLKNEFILAEPKGAALANYINNGVLGTELHPFAIEGIGQNFIPSICDFSLTKKAYSISDTESFKVLFELLKKEGVLGGTSTGTLLAAALKYCREQTQSKNVVSFVCDGGERYISKLFS